MRRVLALLLALLALSACGAEGPGEDVPPEEMRAVSEERDTPPAGSDPTPEHPDSALPELTAVEPLSAPALVTEGRAPAEDYRLPPSVDADPDRLWENYQDWAYSGNITGLLAEVPEADAAFYGLPLPVSGREPGRALIRWGDSLAEFDWRDGLPRMVRPQLYCFDADRDQQEELVIISHAGGGTGISIEELHVIEKGPDGTLTDYQFPRSLWQEQMSEPMSAAALEGQTFAILGEELVWFDTGDADMDLETACTGSIANFSAEDWGDIQFHGAFCLSPVGNPVPWYVAETSAGIEYQDGVFTLCNFHLHSYNQ